MGGEGTTRAGAAPSAGSSSNSGASGLVVRALGRMSGRAVGSNRFVRAGYSAAQTTLRTFTRVLHVLWLEVTGLFFMAFAAVGAIALVAEYRAYAAGKVGVSKAAAAGCFTVVFAYFGLSSFWRSRRRSKQN